MSFSFAPKEAGFEIAQIETSKDQIEQPAPAKDARMLIPPLGSSIVISGKSGSGKSTLLANLIKDARFYGKSPERPDGWFDKIFLFSPTANGDDVQKSLDIPSNHVFTDLEDAPSLLEVILDTQQDKLDKAGGAHEVQQYCIIFDDVIGDVKFMNSKEFTRCFYQVRHVNCTTFICTQHFKRVPRICRLQANFIFFFQGSASEVETISEDFAPPMYTKNEFRSLVNEATRQKYTFLTINMKIGWDFRFRKNLDEFIVLDRIGTENQSDQDKDSSDDSDDSDEKKKENYAGYSKTDEDIETSCRHFTQHAADEQSLEDEHEHEPRRVRKRAHS